MQKSKDAKKEEKIKGLEDKRDAEIKEMQEEEGAKKKQGLIDIKNKFNQLCMQINIDSDKLQEILHKN